MKLARIGIIAAAMLAVSSVAFAQKPDFSGTWAPDAAAAPAPAPAAGRRRRRGGGGGPMTVKQTATTLTIERTAGENKIVHDLQARRHRVGEQDDGPWRRES